jgi:hypothetical protein
MKYIVKELIPRIFSYISCKFKILIFKDKLLFDGHDKLFRNEIHGVTIYGEYGCGISTNWVIKNTEAKVLSVDTSKEWVDYVIDNIKLKSDKVKIFHTDLGEVKKWGYPKSYKKNNLFYLYTNSIWVQTDKPEFVLIDGRFRVCCFLTSLKYGLEGTKIIFDDYNHRPEYHFVEKYLQPLKKFGRQSLFVIPSKKKIDLEELNKDIESFRFVMD